MSFEQFFISLESPRRAESIYAAALADSGKPPSWRRYSIGAERKYIAAVADWESRLLGGGSQAVP